MAFWMLFGAQTTANFGRQCLSAAKVCFQLAFQWSESLGLVAETESEEKSRVVCAPESDRPKLITGPHERALIPLFMSPPVWLPRQSS